MEAVDGVVPPVLVVAVAVNAVWLLSGAGLSGDIVLLELTLVDGTFNAELPEAILLAMPNMDAFVEILVFVELVENVVMVVLVVDVKLLALLGN